MTMLANHVVYRACLMNPADRSLPASSFAASHFWEIGRTSLNIDNRWVMTSGLTHNMSAGVHANMSIFFFSAACMISASAAAKVVPTVLFVEEGDSPQLFSRLQPALGCPGIEVYQCHGWFDLPRSVLPGGAVLSGGLSHPEGRSVGP